MDDFIYRSTSRWVEVNCKQALSQCSNTCIQKHRYIHTVCITHTYTHIYIYIPYADNFQTEIGENWLLESLQNFVYAAVEKETYLFGKFVGSFVCWSTKQI